jgi:uncharacterized membrane-anchored protein
MKNPNAADRGALPRQAGARARVGPAALSVGLSAARTAARAMATLALMMLLGAAPARAATPMSDAEREQVFQQANQSAQDGPADIALGAQAVLHLPAGHRFVPQPLAGRVLTAMGNPGEDPKLQGLVFPAGGERWFMTVRYEDSGHVKDDDARDWQADALLQSYKDGTEAANAEREAMGAPALEVIGWVEPPAYDATTHRLVWAMASREKGAPADRPQGVNFNTYALGREGYFSLNLITGLAELPTYRPVAASMLSALEYNPGQRYADFNASTDRVAEYGLAALVVGVAAKKLGLLAVVLAFVLKFAKVILIGVAGVGAVAVRVFRRKPSA